MFQLALSPVLGVLLDFPPRLTRATRPRTLHNMVHSFHLAQLGFGSVVRALCRPPRPRTTPGLVAAECMFPMRLGEPIGSRRRWQVGTLAMFAAWQDDAAVTHFLESTALGNTLARGWHVRLGFLRRWGTVAGFEDLPLAAQPTALDSPVVVLTLARLRLLQTQRFLHWGLPVERQVRDAPGTTLALAATRPLRTIATFTVWQTAKHMLDMVHGSPSSGQSPHQAGMQERARRDFHHEFTTLRFTCLSEFGTWEGQSRIVPTKIS